MLVHANVNIDDLKAGEPAWQMELDALGQEGWCPHCSARPRRPPPGRRAVSASGTWVTSYYGFF